MICNVCPMALTGDKICFRGKDRCLDQSVDTTMPLPSDVRHADSLSGETDPHIRVDSIMCPNV